MAPNPEGGAQLWGEGPAGNEMPNMEDDGRGEDGGRSAGEHIFPLNYGNIQCFASADWLENIESCHEA